MGEIALRKVANMADPISRVIVNELVDNCLRELREIAGKRQEEITERERIKAMKEVVLGYLDFRKSTFKGLIDRSFDARELYLNAGSKLLEVDTVQSNPELCTSILGMMADILKSNPLGGLKELGEATDLGSNLPGSILLPSR